MGHYFGHYNDLAEVIIFLGGAVVAETHSFALRDEHTCFWLLCTQAWTDLDVVRSGKRGNFKVFIKHFSMYA